MPWWRSRICSVLMGPRRDPLNIEHKGLWSDHFNVYKEIAHRVLDEYLIDSDHQAIFIKLRVMKSLKKKTEPRQEMSNLDHSNKNNPKPVLISIKLS